MVNPSPMELFDVKTQVEVQKADHPIVLRAFDRIRQAATIPEEPRLKCVAEWLDKVMVYNVPHGKQNRLLQVIQSFETFSTKRPSTKQLEEAAILGWTIELLQSVYLITDDMMDNSVTRRGLPCWYLVDEVGHMAVNDAFLIETLIFRLVRDFFREHPSYIAILELLLEVHYQTSRGQCLDMLSERKQVFTEERYNLIVKYKTAFYTFSGPIRLGLLLNNIVDPNLHEKVEKLALKLGRIFQVQDDYLDCYGDPDEIGKVGTDIIDAKCSWLLVHALRAASADQRIQLVNNIGRGESGGHEEQIVKSIYRDLDLEKEFRAYETAVFEELREDLNELESTEKINLDIFKLTMNKIYRRRK